MKVLGAKNKALGGEVSSLPLNLLHLTVQNKTDVAKRFYPRVEDSLKTKGLLNPVVVFKTTAAEWRGAFFTQAEEMVRCPKDFKDNEVVYLVMCGNNRCRAATALNYTHIDAIVCTNLEEVGPLCKKQRQTAL